MKKLRTILKVITSTKDAVTKTVGGSFKFIDKLLEKEMIIGTIEEIKDQTGKVIEKSGELYQKTVDKVEEIKDSNKEEE